MTKDRLPVPSDGYGPAVTKLADTVRHVVDLVAGPDRLRAKAQAQADAEVMLAESRAQVQEVEARAIERIRRREVRRQQNIEAITVEAAKALPPPDKVSAAPVSEDWTTRFFEECKDISDKEMQSLWARILAGEIATPGTFAPKTLSVVRDLTKSEAELFTRLCSYAWHIAAREFDNYNLVMWQPEPKGALHFGALAHLDVMGLINFSVAPVGNYFAGPTREARADYFGKRALLRSDHDRQLEVGRAMFTVAGRQLCSICAATPSEEQRLATLKQWKQDGWTLEDLSAPTEG